MFPQERRKFPFYGFIENMSDFAPIPKKEQKSLAGLVIHCSTCGKNHPIKDACKVEDME
jgi:hypothetical protein